MKSRTPPLKPILVSWIGDADLKAAEGAARTGLGPIAQAAAFKEFARIVLLSDSPADRVQRYRDWWQTRSGAALEFHPVTLSSPMHFNEIYQAARQVLGELTTETAPLLTLHFSPGTLAMRSAPVLIEGESGTGKELLARAIHTAGSRRDQPFIAINCGVIPAELVESELFGHQKGAFTGAGQERKGVFEAADGGTLFLDEVGELPPIAQVKLLRVLQEQTVTRALPVNAWIIVATHRQLVTDMQDGRFREGLFYRLAVAMLKLPPLRGREGDLRSCLKTPLVCLESIRVSVNVVARYPSGRVESPWESLKRHVCWFGEP